MESLYLPGGLIEFIYMTLILNDALVIFIMLYLYFKDQKNVK